MSYLTCLQAISGSQVHGEILKEMWSGQLNDKDIIIAVYVYMSTTRLEYEIVDINVRLNLIMKLNPTVRLSVFLKH